MLHVGLSIVAGYTEKSPLQVQYYRASISEERAEITKRHHVCFFRSYLISDKTLSRIISRHFENEGFISFCLIFGLFGVF